MVLPPVAGGSDDVSLVAGIPPSIERLAAADALNPEPNTLLNIFRGEGGVVGSAVTDVSPSASFL